MKIGIFDSGLGGLVITKTFIREMPGYDYIYYGDTANLPYGDKNGMQILQYTIEAIKFLISQDCGLIIIACNTATSFALRFLQQKFIPFFAPEVKVLGVVIPTVEGAYSELVKRVGIIATQATVRSGIYEFELHKLNPSLKVESIAAPDLVPLIESSRFAEAQEAIQNYTQQFDHPDCLILGCTHYPLLKEYFRKEMPGVKIISQDELMGPKLYDYLQRHQEIDCKLDAAFRRRFIVSNLNQHYIETAERLFPGITIEEKQ